MRESAPRSDRASRGAMPRGGASRVAVLALIALATSAAPRRATADRARLPRDARDERLDDDDARLRAEEHVAYASDARSRVGLRATARTRGSGSSESRSRRGRTCTEIS